MCIRDRYVAVLQKDGGSPAFILTVDGATRNFTVRKVGAAADPGKSFELWLISDRLPRPRSLGVIGGGDFTARAVLASYDTDIVNAATYAVTVEQAGGSPDGNPHSAPVFTGKMCIRDSLQAAQKARQRIQRQELHRDRVGPRLCVARARRRRCPRPGGVTLCEHQGCSRTPPQTAGFLFGD